MSIVNTDRTGSVFIRNFDEGVVWTLGVYVGKHIDTEGNEKDAYLLDVPGVGTGIPVIMNQPESEFENFTLPSCIIRRGAPASALNRWPSVADAYRKGFLMAPNQRRVIMRSIAYPFDITYTIEVLTRLRNQANAFLEYVLRIYKPYSQVDLRDSLGEDRSYTAYMEGIVELDEIVDPETRMLGYSIELRVEGELTLDDEHEFPGVADDPIQVNLGTP